MTKDNEKPSDEKRLCWYDALVQHYLEYRPLSDDAMAVFLANLVFVHFGDEPPALKATCQ